MTSQHGRYMQDLQTYGRLFATYYFTSSMAKVMNGHKMSAVLLCVTIQSIQSGWYIRKKVF